MPAWVIPQVRGTNLQSLSHWFPAHTLAAAVKPEERTNCALQAGQLLLGTPTQQAGPPADDGYLCYRCARRPAAF